MLFTQENGFLKETIILLVVSHLFASGYLIADKE